MGSVAVLASGNGSNFAAIVDRIGTSTHTVSCLICDRPGAKVIERAELVGVSSIVIPYGAGREAAEERVVKVLRQHDPCLVALAGFMRILSRTMVEEYDMRLVNIHPSLLPRHPGLHAIERSYESGDEELGVTVHYVDSGVDTGPIIEQRAFHRLATDTLESIEKRIHQLEHQLYPVVVTRLLDEADRRRGRQE